tara:strand:- start:3036 stop:3662 length:627 start_codon:yes stop_codon:yes gene_type:complete
MSEKVVKQTAAQQALSGMPAISQAVETAGQQAVETARAAPGILGSARQAALRSTAREAGRSAAMGRQAGGWGMGSSMQALAANLAGQQAMAGQRLQFAEADTAARQAAAQAGLDYSMFQEQRAADSAAAVADIPIQMLNYAGQTKSPRARVEFALSQAQAAATAAEQETWMAQALLHTGSGGPGALRNIILGRGYDTSIPAIAAYVYE